jgi:hypothetical protein
MADRIIPHHIDLYSSVGYEFLKANALHELHHAIEQGQRDQWFNALQSTGAAVRFGAAALQSIINRGSWKVEEEVDAS